jgi:uncharacterized protein YbcI
VSTGTRLDRQNRDEILTAIAEEIVRVHARSSGSHPVRVRTTWNEDCLVCVLDRVLTEPERVLIAAGRMDRVRSDREALRKALEPSLRAMVEAETGLAVQAYLTQVSSDGFGLEAFVLG